MAFGIFATSAAVAKDRPVLATALAIIALLTLSVGISARLASTFQEFAIFTLIMVLIAFVPLFVVVKHYKPPENKPEKRSSP